MPLRHVAELVPEHGCQFIAAVDGADQTKVHAHIAAWQCKGVDTAVTQQEKLPGKSLIQLVVDFAAGTRRRHQRQPDRLHVVAQHRVVNIVGIAINTGGNAVPNASFRSSRELQVIAECRQCACAAWHTPTNCPVVLRLSHQSVDRKQRQHHGKHAIFTGAPDSAGVQRRPHRARPERGKFKRNQSEQKQSPQSYWRQSGPSRKCCAQPVAHT